MTKTSRTALVIIIVAALAVCVINAQKGRWRAIQNAATAKDSTPSLSAFGDTDAVKGRRLVIGVVGDALSRAGSPNIPDTMAQTLVNQKEAALIVILNEAHGSTGTCEWVPHAQSGLLVGALADFHARRVRYVIIDIGTYDSAGSVPLPPALFAIQLKQVVRAFTRAGDKVLLEPPSTPHVGLGQTQWDAATPARIAAYRKSMAEVANGRTVFCGSQPLVGGSDIETGQLWAGDFVRTFLR